jgi:D-glycero-D-manno-heptose 1,7-bisphosphate phosphatase
MAWSRQPSQASAKRDEVGIGPVNRPAIFLDRDGVLVEEVFYAQTGEWEAPLCPEDVRLVEGTADALRELSESGYVTVVISNQGGYAKGKTSLRALWLAHERFIELFAESGVKLDRVFYSYAHPEGMVPHFSGPSLDRKPSPYNLMIAAAQLELDLSSSWMIGDRESDIACAQAAGVRAILVENPNAPVANSDAQFRCQTLAEAVRYIRNGCSIMGAAASRLDA